MSTYETTLLRIVGVFRGDITRVHLSYHLKAHNEIYICTQWQPYCGIFPGRCLQLRLFNAPCDVAITRNSGNYCKQVEQWLECCQPWRLSSTSFWSLCLQNNQCPSKTDQQSLLEWFLGILRCQLQHLVRASIRSFISFAYRTWCSEPSAQVDMVISGIIYWLAISTVHIDNSHAAEVGMIG
jgi:hypothetical protein